MAGSRDHTGLSGGQRNFFSSSFGFAGSPDKRYPFHAPEQTQDLLSRCKYILRRAFTEENDIVVMNSQATSEIPELRSFVDVSADSHFPIYNLPFGIFKPRALPARAGIAIGDLILDLEVLAERGYLGDVAKGEKFFSESTLNRFIASGRENWISVRRSVTALLREDNPTLRDDAALRQQAFHRMSDVTMLLPIAARGYTDFYSSIEHATNVGALFRGRENALMPNWRHIPIAYDGRASSLVVSGTDFMRPKGQSKPVENEPPVFGPSRALDFELELAFVVGAGNALGQPIPVDRAEEHIFGALLMNDWSARDIQKWEYQPLGPFLGKNFCTSLSAWIVPLAALEPFKVSARDQDPEPLPYLRSARKVFDINLEVSLRSAKMAAGSDKVISQTNSRNLYWDHCQQLAHHSSNGCSMQVGDIFATGTISGETPHSMGSMLELTVGGSQPLQLPTGETRRFLDDGDTITMTGWCQGKNYRLGFGKVVGSVLPALS